MRDVQDFHKYVDMLSKSVTRRSPQDRSPLSEREEAGEEDMPRPRKDAPSADGAPVAESRPRSLPPRTGRGPRPAETREQLLRRLLDPTLTLDETARILEVCPTTVRRYTDRTHNPLPCQRSAGNQRRFKLSQVLEFKEGQTTPTPGASG